MEFQILQVLREFLVCESTILVCDTQMTTPRWNLIQVKLGNVEI